MTSVAATVISSTLLLCTAPRHVPGTVDVEVAFRTSDHSASGVQFLYQLSTLHLAFPFHGPTSGNTTLTLAASNLSPPCPSCYLNSDLWCVFGEWTKVPAFYESTNHVSCVTPEYSGQGGVSISVQTEGATLLDNVMFVYDAPIVALQLFPVTGPSKGGTQVTIRCSSVQQQAMTMCQFGSSPTLARVTSYVWLQCVSPPAVAGGG